MGTLRYDSTCPMQRLALYIRARQPGSISVMMVATGDPLRVLALVCSTGDAEDPRYVLVGMRPGVAGYGLFYFTPTGERQNVLDGVRTGAVPDELVPDEAQAYGKVLAGLGMMPAAQN